MQVADLGRFLGFNGRLRHQPRAAPASYLPLCPATNRASVDHEPPLLRQGERRLLSACKQSDKLGF